MQELAPKRRKPGNTRDPLRDCAGTPPDFFAELHAKYHFTVDACALPFNCKLDRYWAPKDWLIPLGTGPRPLALNGLAQDWTGERVWINPPYGKGLIALWVDKALHEVRAGGCGLAVMLLPSRTEMPWFHKLWRANAVEFLAHRVKFVAPPGLEQDFKKSSNFERSFLAVIR